MKYLLSFLLMAGCCAYGITEQNTSDNPVTDCNAIENPSGHGAHLDTILRHISEVSSTLKAFECDLSYLIIQDPDIVDSETVQTGKLYYQKDDNGSQLRIRFDKLKQDDFPAEEYIEDFYFDGVWLTKVNYKLEQINLYQQAPENKPVDVFELINSRFPLIGLSGSDTLEKDFDVSIVNSSGNDPNKPIQLLLTVKNDSKYQEDYKKVDFWLDNSTYLPDRVKAYSTQGDIYDIRFLDIFINKKLKNGVFKIETPSGFRKNIEALDTVQK